MRLSDYLTLCDKGEKTGKFNYFLYKFLNDFDCFKTPVCGVYTTDVYVYMFACTYTDLCT